MGGHPHGVPGKIPARAGTTAIAVKSIPRCAEDPRACGDDDAPDAAPSTVLGRSPRVRGRLTSAPWRRCGSRKIPARAGTTARRSSGESTTAEDPRACGDDRRPPSAAMGYPGRSPRVRGRHVLRGGQLAARRKIPARAGTTGGAAREPGPRREDPRACGDDEGQLVGYDGQAGRSPRVRGRRQLPGAGRRGRGKIPARAGTTRCGDANAVLRKEDPRACGDDVVTEIK